jgi:hypothetical protein
VIVPISGISAIHCPAVHVYMHERGHRACNRTDPRDGTQDDGHVGQVIVVRNGPGDPVFQVLDHAVKPLLQFAVDVLEHHSGPKLLVRADLSQKPLAHLHQLGSFRCQGSEKAQFSCGKTAACFGSECEETGDEFCIDPVGLGARAPALRKRLHLGWRHLAGCNAFCLQECPELPFLTASRLKTDNGLCVPGKVRHCSVADRSVGHSAAMPIWQAMKVQPIAADVYADDPAM